MDIKQQLNKRLAEILNEKSENSVIYSRATYDKIVNDLLQIQAKGACSAETIRIAYFWRRAQTDSKKKKNGKIRLIATLEEMFSIVRDVHLRIGHWGERKTFLEIKKK
ncbi:hypothetical protein T4D_10228 [Trichinella pseudospiralis]|uniref:Uncharacterized protein n=1 Tax=Trichinella pseudospiralis TaxID=6337 RepID=A0A0V1G456_TRIPS|nr:hypothetical protein T4D_10228 [Trichinella pseudospiralis]